MTASRSARLARWLWCEAIRRPLPHGLVHWRYVLPRPSGPLARQRSLWLSSLPVLPRPIWLVAEAWLWLKWQVWHGPIGVWRAVRGAGPRVQREEGLGLGLQAWRVAALSLGYCLPPGEVYRYRLYRQPHRAPEFVYDHTVATFHQRRNSSTSRIRESLRLLMDKERQAAELSALGVPTVPTLAVARKRSGVRLETLIPVGAALFCKPRHGSAGRGAAAVTSAAGSVAVETLDGHRITGPRAASWWAGHLRRDDMILQPRLRTHPELADLATVDDVATVRYISQREGDEDNQERAGVGCYCAILELPVGRPVNAGFPHYVMVEVDPLSGRVLGFPAHLLPREAAAACQRVVERVGQRALPGWDRLRLASHLAHGLFPGVHAIAWDWALTPAGPLLLEGNAGWGPFITQVLKGGLLAE